MKKFFFLFLLMCFPAHLLHAQKNDVAFKDGEFLKFKISYGLLNAGIATLELSETTYKNTPVYHAKGVGYTTGVPKLFFKVYDDYQSYFEIDKVIPHRFIRKIDEGGYTKDQEGFFNYTRNSVLVKDYEKQKEAVFPIGKDVQDIVSAFYYLRKSPQIGKIKKGEYIEIDMFFDGEVTKFKLMFLGSEELKTKFGRVATLAFRPYVMAGRVFKEKESLTVWVTDDTNHVPLRIKASLLVGSLKADLEEYSGVVTPIKFKR